MSKSKKPKTDAPKVHVPAFLKDAALARLDDQKALAELPTLCECLLPVYEGTTLIRQAGRISISVEGAHWKVSLDCPSERLATTFAAESLADCLASLEAALKAGHVVWRPGYNKSKKPLPTIDELIQ